MGPAGEARYRSSEKGPACLLPSLSLSIFPPFMSISAERTCRFCFKELPDWRTAHEELPKATPVMVRQAVRL